MLRLEKALNDLDVAASAASPPVWTAIAAELQVEVRDLRHGLALFSEGVEPPEDGIRRVWDDDAPFVTSEEALSDHTRHHLDEQEDEASAVKLCRGVADLQMLYDVLGSR
ncbi:hypothetical protein JOF29_003688 [Kribbella aluminosa]|uniref:Uncharacterized protein n=1 Tax=Kribbella aluminosa TaxID=416017 RepID=A0ABS4ULV1_9ACTN|nr:hypothetical protein [Kribbella aluminosa]MBP2352605.1 hypothetical protein [Kribbella aluminosa]